MFCTECGKKIKKGEKFCSGCGKNLVETSEKKTEEAVAKNVLKLNLMTKTLLAIGLLLVVTVIMFLIFKVNTISWIISLVLFVGVVVLQFVFPKLSLIKIVGLIGVLVISTVTILILDSSLGSNNHNKDTNKKIEFTNSSVVSKGVNKDDLGNIVNGQFYFVEGNYAFYSTFDTEGNSHVYSKNLSTGDIKQIFDGFGWSFVVYNGWLYFSGNPGIKIDATYKLYRIQTDGNNLQLLNANYTYNMYFYKGWVYYMRQADQDAEIAQIYRSNLDGTSEEMLVANTGYQSIIYENSLYYVDADGYLFKADIEGKNAVKIYPETIKTFVIGQGNILFLDSGSNIKKATPDGSNVTTIKANDGSTITRINSYKDTILYTTYGDYLSNRMAYEYSIHTIDITGANERIVYAGLSIGFWNNVVDGKIYVLDYAQDLNINRYIAVSKSMNIDGSSLSELYRK